MRLQSDRLSGFVAFFSVSEKIPYVRDKTQRKSLLNESNEQWGVDAGLLKAVLSTLTNLEFIMFQ